MPDALSRASMLVSSCLRGVGGGGGSTGQSDGWLRGQTEGGAG